MNCETVLVDRQAGVLTIKLNRPEVLNAMTVRMCEEIAEVMGITVGAVKASYFHAVKKLRGLLESYGEEHGL